MWTAFQKILQKIERHWRNKNPLNKEKLVYNSCQREGGREPTIPAGERPQANALDVITSEIDSWAFIFGLNQRLLFKHAVDEMPLSIMKTATFDKLFELCKMKIRWNVECDLTIDHYGL